MDAKTQVGPLSSEQALEDLLDQVSRFESSKSSNWWYRAFEQGAYMQPLC
jgi:succinate-semialdehyde dehydrogenase/glutarate-semialdehyde dehydrogenase